MKYQDGNIVHVGDEVKLSNSEKGIVVCSLDNSEFSIKFPKEKWAYLKEGVLIDTSFAGVVHYTDNSDLLALVKRNT